MVQCVVHSGICTFNQKSRIIVSFQRLQNNMSDTLMHDLIIGEIVYQHTNVP
jgi:hypothetical protein